MSLYTTFFNNSIIYSFPQAKKVFLLKGGYKMIQKCLRRRGWVEQDYKAAESATPTATSMAKKQTPKIRKRYRLVHTCMYVSLIPRLISQAYLPGFYHLQYEKRDKSLGDKPGNVAICMYPIM